jgi:hypothetical integral membrane protein (TIGR02206 family)
MPAPLHLFGLVHLLILAAVPLLAAFLVVVQRRFELDSRWLRYSLAPILFLCEFSYYGCTASQGQPIFPDHLPLELCDLSMWLVLVALLTLKPAVFDLAYYYTLAGASMSLLTPDMPRSYPALLAVQFFAEHGLLMIAILYLVWSGQARPRPWSVVRAMLALNVYAVFVGTFDFFFKTDYMFLRARPQTVSALDLLGPWPWYILTEEGVAVVFFLLLYLPFRQTTANAQ